jgi:hypothetical protein
MNVKPNLSFASVVADMAAVNTQIGCEQNTAGNKLSTDAVQHDMADWASQRQQAKDQESHDFLSAANSMASGVGSVAGGAKSAHMSTRTVSGPSVAKHDGQGDVAVGKTVASPRYSQAEITSQSGIYSGVGQGVGSGLGMGAATSGAAATNDGTDASTAASVSASEKEKAAALLSDSQAWSQRRQSNNDDQKSAVDVMNQGAQQAAMA